MQTDVKVDYYVDRASAAGGMPKKSPTEPSDVALASPSEDVCFRNILMATDFSECSDRALRYAIRTAQRYRATLHLFHWINPIAYRMLEEESADAATSAAWCDLQQLQASLASREHLNGIEHTMRIEDGDLGESLNRVVSESQIDLIVIGTHGRTGWRKLILGSIAEEIFRSASCPVLTVGPHVTRSRVKQDGPHDIVFATDSSPESKAAEPYVFSMMSRYGARLTILRVLEHPSENIVQEKQRLRRAHQALRAIAELHHAPLDQTHMAVKVGSPADAILRVAIERRADLIVVGVHRCQTTDHLSWPNAYRVVCESTCPALTVR